MSVCVGAILNFAVTTANIIDFFFASLVNHPCVPKIAWSTHRVLGQYQAQALIVVKFKTLKKFVLSDGEITIALVASNADANQAVERLLGNCFFPF